jgi:hypothetical protein
LTPQNCIALDFESSVAIPTMTNVKSWSARNKAVVSQTAGSGARTTTLIRPNLNNKQAESLAVNHLAGLQMHRTVLQAVMPGELALAPGSAVLVSQTNSGFDQTYLVDLVRRAVDAERGFTQIIRAHAVS